VRYRVTCRCCNHSWLLQDIKDPIPAHQGGGIIRPPPLVLVQPLPKRTKYH